MLDYESFNIYHFFASHSAGHVCSNLFQPKKVVRILHKCNKKIWST